MKAAIRRKYGNHTHITVEEYPTPKPNDNEVLVRVHATTVNRTDCAVLAGSPYVFRFFTGLFGPKTPVLGTDFAGQVEAIGSTVKNFKVGDKVFGFHDDGLPTQAEYLTYPESGKILTMPDNVNYAEAVASLEGPHYALSFINKVKLKPEHKVLLNGATGGIGSAVLQLLKNDNIYVTAVCNTKNIDLIKSLGADKIYDYEKEDFTKDTEKYDFVFDAVGKSSFGICKPLMKEQAVYISSELGPRNENPFLALIAPFMGSKKVIFPIPGDVKKSIIIMKELLSEGKFKPVIDREYALDDIAAAYEYVAAGLKTGNVVVKI
ncbi:MAG: NADPH:quinone reductase-like Zn-dependent oxidoreductase [Saprospiraceae bacterium]|jgi:NADPH:quinone reductase-like Zn-dependent oxidoreductase